MMLKVCFFLMKLFQSMKKMASIMFLGLLRKKVASKYEYLGGLSSSDLEKDDWISFINRGGLCRISDSCKADF